MHPDDIAVLNDEPFGIHGEEKAVFLVRLKQTKKLIAVVVADDMESLFWRVEEWTSPADCECTVMIVGEGVFLGSQCLTPSEHLGDRIGTKRAWRPVDDVLVRRRQAEEERRTKLAKLETEAAELARIFKGLNRIAHDKFNRHR